MPLYVMAFVESPLALEVRDGWHMGKRIARNVTFRYPLS